MQKILEIYQCKLLLVLMVIAVLYSCGDSSSGPSTQTQTFIGTTQATGPTSCASDGHDFQAGEGVITITLVQTTGGTSLVAQICAGGIDNNDCTINHLLIGVGQTVNGTRKGGSSQTLKLLPLNCGGGGPPPATPINYTVTVTYPR